MQLQLEEISESKARAISYVANSYAKLYEVSELEERVEKLEMSLTEQAKEV
jgi:hypothetical protein